MVKQSRRVDITIGSDPEFFFRKDTDEAQVKAREIQDACCFSIDGVGNAGLDGHSDIAELRPKHSVDVRKHICNIQLLLHKMCSNSSLYSSHLTDVGIYAGSWVAQNKGEDEGDGIGGHIHFGLTSGKMRETMRKDLLGDLDYWLAPITLLLEKPDTARKRRKLGTHGHPYGLLGNNRCRTPPWGIEYRPISSWIVSPHIAQGVLCYAQAIAHASVNNKLPSRPYDVNMDVLRKEYREVNQAWLLRHFVKIRKSWRLFPLVTENKYVASGLGILTHLIMNNLKWKEDVDLRDGWGIQRPTPKPKPKPEAKQHQPQSSSAASVPTVTWNISTERTEGGMVWTTNTASF